MPLDPREDLKRDSSFISLCLWPTVPLCEAVEFWRLSGDAGKADIKHIQVGGLVFLGSNSMLEA